MTGEQRETIDLTAVERVFSTVEEITDNTQVMLNEQVVIIPGRGKKITVVAHAQVPVYPEKMAKAVKTKPDASADEFKGLPFTLSENNPTLYIGKDYAVTYLTREGGRSKWLIRGTQAVKRFDLDSKTKADVVLRGLFLKRTSGKTK